MRAKSQRWRGADLIARLFQAVLMQLLLVTAIIGQSAPSPLLQITSPASGIVVTPGANVSISVTSPSNTNFSGVFVLGEAPIGMSNKTESSLPAQFTITIPLDVSLGLRRIAAIGTTSSADPLISDPIIVDVERTDFPALLTPSLSSVELESLGETASVRWNGAFTANVLFDVTNSSYVTYASSDPSVVIVDSMGNITAVGAGNAKVTATYTFQSQAFSVPVPVTVRNPLLTISPSSVTFTSQNIGSTSTPQTITVTNATSDGIRISEVTTSGDFSASNTCTGLAALAPNAICTIDVTFSPTGPDVRTGILSIVNDGNIIAIDVPLTGIGPASPGPTAGGTSFTSPATDRPR